MRFKLENRQAEFKPGGSNFRVGRRFAAALLVPRLYGKDPRSHHKPQARAPPVGFELETNGFQFYAIANLGFAAALLVPRLSQVTPQASG